MCTIGIIHGSRRSLCEYVHVCVHMCVHSWAGADERLDLEKEFFKKAYIYAHLRYIYWGPKFVCVLVLPT